MHVEPYISKETGEVISYRFICCGKNPINNKIKYYRHTWKVPICLTGKKEIERALERAKLDFQDEVDKKSKGRYTKEDKEYILLSEYGDNWVEDIRINRPQSLTYYVRQRDNFKIIKAYFGNGAFISQIGPIDCKNFYNYLSSRTYTKELVKVKRSIQELIDNSNLPLYQLADEMGLCRQSVHKATYLDEPIDVKTARKIAKYFHVPFDKYFKYEIIECKYAKSVNLSIRTTLVMILNEAINDEIILVNYALRAYKGQFDNDPEEVDTYDIDEARKFVKSALAESDIRKRAVFMIFMMHGCRKAELCGLEWKDIDFETNEIHFKRNSIYVNKEFGMITKTTKTKKSNRDNIMPEILIDVLLQYKDYWINEQKRHGEYGEWAKTDRLFVQESGKPISPSIIGQWVADFENRVNLKHISPKQFRHTNISFSYNEADISLKVIADRVGHAQITTTNNHYLHANRKQEQEASRKINALFENL